VRRIAREYALRALYQIDVARQPVGGVLDGILEQIRTPVNHAVEQHLKEAAARARETGQIAIKSGDAADRRRARKTLKLIAECLADLATRLREITSLGVAAEPISIQECLHQMENALAQANRTLDEIAQKEPQHQAIVDAARSRLSGTLDAFRRHAPEASQVAAFAASLLKGTLAHTAELDRQVGAISDHWSLWRQATVDRNILRLAAYELLFEDTPAGVVINEAVELAKKYSTEESGRFVNGILGALAAAASPSDTSPKEHLSTPGN
jgi:transcription antitermination factor NusB